MSESSKGPLISRRKFLGILGAGAGTFIAGGALGFLTGKSPDQTQPQSQVLPPKDLLVPAPTVVTEKLNIQVDPKLVDDFAKILTQGRAKIDPVPTATPMPRNLNKGTPAPTRDLQVEANELNMILYRERAEEVLKFVLAIKPELTKVKPRLAAIARLTDLGKAEPPMPSEKARNEPENSTLLPRNHFESGHFGPQEFINLSHNRLVRMNMALILALVMAEGEKDSRPFSRLVSENYQDRWDIANAHGGRAALMFATGQIDSQNFVYGPNSHGGVLPTADTLYSNRLEDKLIVMLAPPIVNLRVYQFTPKGDETVKDFAAVDQNGKPDWKFLDRWNQNKFLRKKIKQNYEGIEQFVEKHPEFGWLTKESIV